MPEFNDLVSRELFGDPSINQLPLPGPNLTPVNYVMPKPDYDFDRFGLSSSKGTGNPLGDALNGFERQNLSLDQQIRPINFDGEAMNVDRYRNAEDFQRLGIELDGSNEERYGQNQSWGEVLSNGFAGQARLAANGFADNWKGFGRMFDAMVNLDWSKLHGDAESMLALDNETRKIMDENAIFATEVGSDTFWNRETAGNFLQQSGFAVGAFVGMLSEHLITKAVEAAITAGSLGAAAPAAAALEAATDVQTAANVGRWARVMNRTKEFYDAAKNFKALKKLGDVWKDENMVKNFMTAVAQKTPGLDFAYDMYRVGQKGGTAWDITKVGVGGIKRLISEANFAFSEARMEAAGTYSDLYSQLMQQAGPDVTEEEMKNIERISMEAADRNFNFNTAVLAISNRIQFDNIFKNGKVTRGIMSKFGIDDVVEDRLKVVGKIGDRSVPHYYETGWLGGAGRKAFKQVSADFGKGKAFQVMGGSLLKNLGKMEVSEGIQELLQEGSNEYFKDYYKDAYAATTNPDIAPDSGKSFSKALDSQNNMQGFKTFMSGAMTGMVLHGPTALGGRALEYGNEKVTDYTKTKKMSEEQKTKYYEDKAQKKTERARHFEEFNAFAKDPSKVLSESIKNLNFQKEGSTALMDAANAGDMFAYENIRTEMLHKMIASSIRNNTYEGLIDTLRGYGENMSKEEFEKAFVSVEYSSQNKATAKDYTDKIAGSVEGYVKTWNKLQDRYGSRANPARYKFGTPEFLNELIKKKTLDDMIETMAGNEFKATDALDRATKIFQKLSNNKNLGASLANAYNIMGNDAMVIKETTVLEEEIKLKKEQLKTGLPATEVEKIKQELLVKETQLQHLKDWSANKGELINEAKVDKSLKAFKGYVESKNREAGREQVIDQKEADEHFLNLMDYIKLNEKSARHMEAINMLANPTYFDQIHNRMQEGAKEAYISMLGVVGADHVKKNAGDSKSFILEVYGEFVLYDKDGIPVSVHNTMADARKAKTAHDTAAAQKAAEEAPAKPDAPRITIKVKDKNGAELEQEIIEGETYITESESVTRVLPNRTKVELPENDIIKIVSVDPAAKTITFTMNGDPETYKFDADEFAEASGKLYNLKQLTPTQRIFFKNRNKKIVFKVSKQYGTLHRIDGKNANRDYSDNSVEAEGMLKLVKEDGDWVLKIEYTNPVSKKKVTVDYSDAYLKKYGSKKIDLTINPTEAEFIEEDRKRRTARNLANQFAALELMVKEAEDKMALRTKRRAEIDQEIDEAMKAVTDMEETMELAQMYLDDLKGSRKKGVKALREQYTKLIESMPGRISKMKELAAKLQQEKTDLEQEMQVIQQSMDMYMEGLIELDNTKTPFVSGENGSIIDKDQSTLDALKQKQVASYMPTFDAVLADISTEMEQIDGKLVMVLDSIKTLEKTLAKLLKYDELIKTIYRTENSSDKSLKNLRANLTSLKMRERNKENPDREMIEVIDQMLAGLGKTKSLAEDIIQQDVMEAITLLNILRESKKDLGEFLERRAQLQDKFDEYTLGQQQAGEIRQLTERIAFLKALEQAIVEGYRKNQAIKGISQTAKGVTAVTKETAAELAQYADIMSTEPVFVSDDAEDDMFIGDFDKPLLQQGGLFKTADRHYMNDTDATPNTPQAARFFRFSETVNIDGTYYFIPVSKASDLMGITVDFYEDAKGNSVAVTGDIKMMVVKKVGKEFKAVGVDGKVLDNPTKDNIVYTSMPNNPVIVSGTDAEVLELLKGDKSPFTVTGLTDEQILNEVKKFRAFRSNILSRTEKKEEVPLKITGKSKGIQRREPLDQQTNRPQELALQGRLIAETPKYFDLRHPDGSSVELEVVTKQNSASKRIKPGRLVLVKRQANTQTEYQVYNRQLSQAEKDNIFDVILAVLPMFGRKNALSEERKAQLNELFSSGAITSDQLLRLTTPLSETEDKQFDMAMQYLLSVLNWRQLKAGETADKNQFYLSKGSLYVGDKAYRFEIDGQLDLSVLEAAREEIMAGLYHNVNNKKLESSKERGRPFSTVKVVDGTITEDMSFSSYVEYLLTDKKPGHTPVVYTNIKPYAAIEEVNEPQLKNVYLTYEGFKETQEVKPAAPAAAAQAPQSARIDNVPVGTEIAITRISDNKQTHHILIGKWDGNKFTISNVVDANGVDVTQKLGDMVGKLGTDMTNIIKDLDESRKKTEGMGSDMNNPIVKTAMDAHNDLVTTVSEKYTKIQVIEQKPKPAPAATSGPIHHVTNPDTGSMSYAFLDQSGFSVYFNTEQAAKEAYAKMYGPAAAAPAPQAAAPAEPQTAPAPQAAAPAAAPDNVSALAAAKAAYAARQASGKPSKGNYRLAMGQAAERENIALFREWMKQVLPQVGVETADRLIDGRGWGKFINGMIMIYQNAGKGTGFHEAFEAVWNSYLTEKEQMELIAEFQQRKGKFTNPFTGQRKDYRKATAYDVKEMLAEEFIDYMRSENGKVLDGAPKRNTLFRKFLNLIKKLWKNIQEAFGITPETPENSKINEIFRKISTGGFANAQAVSNDYVVDSNFRFALDKTSVEFTQKLMEGMAGYFFVNLYSQEDDNGRRGNIKSLFDASQPQLFEKLYQVVKDDLISTFGDYYDSMVDSLTAAGMNTQQIDDILANDPDSMHRNVAISKLDGEVKDLFKKFIGQFGLKFSSAKLTEDQFMEIGKKDESGEVMTPDELERNDRLGIVEAMYLDPRDMTKAEVKLLIASLTADQYDEDGVTTYRMNDLGLPVLEDFGRKINILLNELHSTVPVTTYNENTKTIDEVSVIDQMFNKLDKRFNKDGVYKPGYEWIAKLKRRLGYEDMLGQKRNIADMTKDEINLLVAFETSFTNNRNIPHKVIVGPDGMIYSDNTIDSTNAKRIKEDWQNAIKYEAKPLGATTEQREQGPAFYIDADGMIRFNLASRELNTALAANTASGMINTLRSLGFDFTASNEEIVLQFGARDISDAFSSIAMQFKDKNINTFDDLFGKQVVNGPVNFFINVERFFTADDTILSTRNAEGKQQYSITMPSAISHLMNSFKAVDNLRDFILSNPHLGQVDPATGEIRVNSYSVNSLLLKPGGALFAEDGSKRPNATLEYRYILGMAGQSENAGTSTDRLEYPDKVTQEIYHLMDGTYFTIINSDKSSEFGIHMGHMISYGELFPSIADNKKVIEMYKDALKGELMAAAFESRSSDVQIKVYSKEVMKLGHFSQITNVEDNPVIKELFEKFLQDERKGVANAADSFTNHPEVEKLLINYMAEKVNENMQWLKDLGLVKDAGSGVVTDVFSREQVQNVTDGAVSYKDNTLSAAEYRRMVMFMTFNRQLAVFEQHKLLYGHPAMYKDLAKRSSGINSQKQPVAENSAYLSWLDRNMPRFDGKSQRTNTFKFISHSDPAAVSRFTKEIAEGMYQSMKKAYEKKGLISKTDQKKLEKIIGVVFDELGNAVDIKGGNGTLIDAYVNANEPDGGAYIMPDFFRDLHFLSGKVKEEQMELLEYENAREILDRMNPNHKSYNVPGFAMTYDENKKQKAQAIVDAYTEKYAKTGNDAVLQVLKPQGFGYQTTAGRTHTTLLKHSVVPLTWSRVVNNPNMLGKYLQAQEDKVDIIGFESGQKVGLTIKQGDRTIQDIYDENGKYNDKRPPVQEMYTKYYGFQVEMASYAKEEVIFGSQMRKLNLANLPAELRPAAEEYNRLIDSLTQSEFDDVLEQLGLRQEGEDYVTDDLKRMVDTLRAEVERRDLPDNIVDMLVVMTDQNGNESLQYRFDASPIREKLDNILNAIVDNRILGQTMFGKASVQVPSTMFESSDRLFTYKQDDGKYAAPVKASELTKEQRKKAKMVSSDLEFYDGKDGSYMEVMVPHYFKGILPENINLAELDPRLLRAIGFRIPSQGLNSIETIKIKGFLDPQWGDMIVVPTEIVAKSGSDFDIDKMNLFLANYYINKKTGQPEYIEYSTSDDEVKDRYIDYVDSNVSKDTKKYVQTLEKLSGVKDSLKQKYQENKDDILKKFEETRKQNQQEYNSSEQRIMDLATRSKNSDATIVAYKAEGLKLFSTLPVAIKQPFYDLKDSGILSVAENKALAERLLQANPNARYASTLMQMIQYHDAMLDVYAQINSWTVEQLQNLKDRASTVFDNTDSWKESNLEANKEQFRKDLKEQRFVYTQELARVGNLPVLEDFAKLPIAEQNSKKARQNRLIELMGEIVGSQQNYRQLVVPNGAETLKKLANDIRDLKKLPPADMDKTSLSEWKTMTEVRERYVTGKKLVGVIALQITSHALSQYGDIEMTGYYKQGDNNVDIKIKMNVNTPEGKFMLNLIEDKGYKWISELLSEAMTGAVDAAKDPFIFDLNLTMKTASTWFYLQKLGVPVEDIAYLHVQPLVEDYFKEMGKNSSLLNTVNEKKLGKAKVKMLAMEPYLMKAFPELKQQIASVFGEFETFRSIVELSETPLMVYDPVLGASRDVNNAKYRQLDNLIGNKIEKLSLDKITGSMLKAMIKPTNEKTAVEQMSAEEAQKQIMVLNEYLLYQDQAGFMDNFIRALSYDTKRTKNIIENEIQKATYQQAIDDEFVTKESLSRLMNSTFLGQMKKIKDSVPDMFKNFFVTVHPKSKPVMKKALDTILADKFMSNEEKVELLNRYQNFFLNYLLHTGKIKVDGKEFTLNNYYKQLFMGNNSVPKQLKRMQDKYPDNKALKNLFAMINTDTNDTDNIKLFNSKLSSYEINSIGESLLALKQEALATNDQQLLRFTKQLTIFVMAQSGVQVSPISYTKVMPIELYSQTVADLFDSYLSDDNFQVDPETVWRQFHQNNYKNTKLVDQVKYKSAFGPGIKNFRNKGEFVTVRYYRPEVVGRRDIQEQLIKNKDWDAVFDYVLYQRLPNTKEGELPKYVPINKLGDGMYMIEASNTPYAESILAKNGKINMDGYMDAINESKNAAVQPADGNTYAPEGLPPIENTNQNSC